ncbi:MAG: hypothetical protein EZS28_017931, partial [Streblomastix strix]
GCKGISIHGNISNAFDMDGEMTDIGSDTFCTPQVKLILRQITLSRETVSDTSGTVQQPICNPYLCCKLADICFVATEVSDNRPEVFINPGCGRLLYFSLPYFVYGYDKFNATHVYHLDDYYSAMDCRVAFTQQDFVGTLQLMGTPQFFVEGVCQSVKVKEDAYSKFEDLFVLDDKSTATLNDSDLEILNPVIEPTDSNTLDEDKTLESKINKISFFFNQFDPYLATSTTIQINNYQTIYAESCITQNIGKVVIKSQYLSPQLTPRANLKPKGRTTTQNLYNPQFSNSNADSKKQAGDLFTPLISLSGNGNMTVEWMNIWHFSQDTDEPLIYIQQLALLQLNSVVFMKSNLTVDNTSSTASQQQANIDTKKSPFIYAVNGGIIMNSTQITAIQLDNVPAIQLFAISQRDSIDSGDIGFEYDDLTSTGVSMIESVGYDVTIIDSILQGTDFTIIDTSNKTDTQNGSTKMQTKKMKNSKIFIDSQSSYHKNADNTTAKNQTQIPSQDLLIVDEGDPTCSWSTSSIKFKEGKLNIQGNTKLIDLGIGVLHIGVQSEVQIDSSVIFEGNTQYRNTDGSIHGAQRKNILCYGDINTELKDIAYEEELDQSNSQNAGTGGINYEGLWILNDEFCDIQLDGGDNVKSLFFEPKLTGVSGSENKKKTGMNFKISGSNLVKCSSIWLEITNAAANTSQNTSQTNSTTTAKETQDDYIQKYSINIESKCLRVLLENANPAVQQWKNDETEISFSDMPYDGYVYGKGRTMHVRLRFSDGKPDSIIKMKERILRLQQAQNQTEQKMNKDYILNEEEVDQDQVAEQEFFTLLQRSTEIVGLVIGILFVVVVGITALIVCIQTRRHSLESRVKDYQKEQEKQMKELEKKDKEIKEKQQKEIENKLKEQKEIEMKEIQNQVIQNKVAVIQSQLVQGALAAGTAGALLGSTQTNAQNIVSQTVTLPPQQQTSLTGNGGVYTYPPDAWQSGQQQFNQTTGAIISNIQPAQINISNNLNPTNQTETPVTAQQLMDQVAAAAASSQLAQFPSDLPLNNQISTRSTNESDVLKVMMNNNSNNLSDTNLQAKQQAASVALQQSADEKSLKPIMTVVTGNVGNIAQYQFADTYNAIPDQIPSSTAFASQLMEQMSAVSGVKATIPQQSPSSNNLDQFVQTKQTIVSKNIQQATAQVQNDILNNTNNSVTNNIQSAQDYANDIAPYLPQVVQTQSISIQPVTISKPPSDTIIQQQQQQQLVKEQLSMTSGSSQSSLAKLTQPTTKQGSNIKPRVQRKKLNAQSSQSALPPTSLNGNQSSSTGNDGV